MITRHQCKLDQSRQSTLRVLIGCKKNTINVIQERMTSVSNNMASVKDRLCLVKDLEGFFVQKRFQVREIGTNTLAAMLSSSQQRSKTCPTRIKRQ